MDDSKRQQVVEKIKAAFSTAPEPETHSGDGVGVENEVQGKPWSEITPAYLLKHHEKLPLLSTAAYGFYLPAYLLGVVLHFDELELYEVPARLVRSLAPPKDYQNRLVERVEHFTTQQKEAVYDFLLYYKTLYPKESWSYFPEDKRYLDAAIEFWGNAAKGNP